MDFFGLNWNLMEFCGKSMGKIPNVNNIFDLL